MQINPASTNVQSNLFQSVNNRHDNAIKENTIKKITAEEFLEMVASAKEQNGIMVDERI